MPEQIWKNKFKNSYGRIPVSDAFKLNFLDALRQLFFKNTSLRFAQTGEDSVIEFLLKRYLGNIKNGFYIDVGCNHPYFHSLTFLLYIKGWRGIVVDANENWINEFNEKRKLDIAVHAAVSDSVKEVVYHQFEMHQLNTIDEQCYKDKENTFATVGDKALTTNTLQQIVEQHLPLGQPIDLLCIDVEGQDFQAIRTLDFAKYRPKLICIEVHPWDLRQIHLHPVHMFLTKKGYTLINFATYNAYFIDTALLNVKQ